MRKLSVTLLISFISFLNACAQMHPVDLNGTWRVTITQESDDEPISYQINVSIKQVGDLVIGEFDFKLQDIPIPFERQLKSQEDFKTPFSGKIINGHLSLNYDNPNPEIDQFGSAMLKIESGKKMTGRFLGFGPELQTIVQGALVFDRQ